MKSNQMERKESNEIQTNTHTHTHTHPYRHSEQTKQSPIYTGKQKIEFICAFECTYHLKDGKAIKANDRATFMTMNSMWVEYLILRQQSNGILT